MAQHLVEELTVPRGPTDLILRIHLEVTNNPSRFITSIILAVINKSHPEKFKVAAKKVLLKMMMNSSNAQILRTTI